MLTNNSSYDVMLLIGPEPGMVHTYKNVTEIRVDSKVLILLCGDVVLAIYPQEGVIIKQR